MYMKRTARRIKRTRLTEQILLPFQAVFVAIEPELRRHVTVVVVTDSGTNFLSDFDPFWVFLAGENVKVRSGVNDKNGSFAQVTAAEL